MVLGLGTPRVEPHTDPVLSKSVKVTYRIVGVTGSAAIQSLSRKGVIPLAIATKASTGISGAPEPIEAQADADDGKRLDKRAGIIRANDNIGPTPCRTALAVDPSAQDGAAVRVRQRRIGKGICGARGPPQQHTYFRPVFSQISKVLSACRQGFPLQRRHPVEK